MMFGVWDGDGEGSAAEPGEMLACADYTSYLPSV